MSEWNETNVNEWDEWVNWKHWWMYEMTEVNAMKWMDECIDEMKEGHEGMTWTKEMNEWLIDLTYWMNVWMNE